MTAPAFIYTSEPWAALPFGRPIFRPSVHAGANECGSFAPVLFLFARHRRSRRVFHFKPVRRASRTVGRVLPLRHDAFEPHLAGMGEHGRAVALDMLVEPNTGTGLTQDRCERGLADLKRITPQVVA